MSDYQGLKLQTIWEDDTKTTVFAQVYGASLTVIFSFTADSKKSPSSLATLVCKAFHSLDVPDEQQSLQFPNHSRARKLVSDSIQHIWADCVEDEAISNPDTVVDLDSGDGSLARIVWRTYSHPAFPRYLEILADEQSGKIEVPTEQIRKIPLKDVIRYGSLGGSARARLKNDPDTYVLKGVGFAAMLSRSGHGGDARVRRRVRGWRNAVNILLNEMPAHPNVSPPPVAQVTVDNRAAGGGPGSSEEHRRLLVCGCLWHLLPGGDAAARIDRSTEAGVRLPLALKAHWCADMAAAVAHTHHVANLYHMDIRPGNFIADADDNLVLAGWEQVDASASTLAPEADGTYDVVEVDDFDRKDAGTETFSALEAAADDARHRRPWLRYTKYDGLPRCNVPPETTSDLADAPPPWRVWNVFPAWNVEHPLAVELAEVFSLGRTMWILLRQPSKDYYFDEIHHPIHLVTDWEDSDDVPAEWRRFVDRCMSLNPNDRPGVLEVAGFWGREWKLRRD